MIGFALLGCDIDPAMLVMRAASGALMHINNSRRCADGYDQRIEVFGPAGRLQAHNRHLTIVQPWSRERTRALESMASGWAVRLGA